MSGETAPDTVTEALERAWTLGYEQAVKDASGQRGDNMLDAPARARANYRAADWLAELSAAAPAEAREEGPTDDRHV